MKSDTIKCKRCDGTGEEYRPELRIEDGPWFDCLGCHGYGFEQSEESLRHTVAVLAESWRVGWPAIFKTDVEVHDMRALADRDASKPFAWMLRETGSWIILPEEWNKREPLQGFLQVASALVSGEERIAYWWNGKELRRVSPDVMIAELRAACELELEREFERSAA